jgi:hypothetical protein
VSLVLVALALLLRLLMAAADLRLPELALASCGACRVVGCGRSGCPSPWRCCCSRSRRAG